MAAATLPCNNIMPVPAKGPECPPMAPFPIPGNKSSYPPPPPATDKGKARFPRIGKPVHLMKEEYDCVVIGSGYGGSIAASRMARAGQSVCVLERGRERWPGEYPSSLLGALGELHVSGNLAPWGTSGAPVENGDPTAMFRLLLGKGQSAFCANGLGGTSLINANVFLEADAGTLANDAWPPEIVAELDQYYKKVRTVLEPEPYPDVWPSLPKLDLLKKQADALGLGDRFSRVEQTTRFHDGPNSCGVEMSASTLSGEDSTGLNDGSKTSTLVTYVADAWNWGADIFCECEVRHIAKAEDEHGNERPGYIVSFAWHGCGRGRFRDRIYSDLITVYAKNAVFLGAGALGTTEILLRSKALGLGMSEQVGKNLSGNGDILAFGYNTKEYAHAVGNPNPSPSDPIGPTIAGMIDCRSGHEHPADGFVIQEGTIPSALASVLQAVLDLTPGTVSPEHTSLRERIQSTLARYGSRFAGPYSKRGAMEATQVYLVMSHDTGQAVLTLQDDKPMLEFIGVGRSERVKRLNDILARATTAVGGTLVHNAFQGFLGKQEITVHPVGGARIARDGTGRTGVVNTDCELLRGAGAETWDGLIVTDGAVIPGALAANPMATIAALAERAVERHAARRGLVISQEKNGVLDLFGYPEHARPFSDETAMWAATRAASNGFAFTELMTGFVHPNPNLVQDTQETYERASRLGETLCQSARVFLSVEALDIDTFLETRQALITGTLSCAAIPGSPFSFRRGTADIFKADCNVSGRSTLVYECDILGVNGKRLHFRGYKVVDSGVAFNPIQLWRSTTTLYVTISDPESRTSVAKGILYLRPGAFISQMLTLKGTGHGGRVARLSTVSRFLAFFAKQSLSPLMGPFAALRYPSTKQPVDINPTPPSQTTVIVAQDGIFTRLHMWEPTNVPGNDPNNIRNVLMIPGASVDHNVFALPTIPFNAVNYLCRAGYRVFVSVHRICKDVVLDDNHWTTYDSRLDIKACFEHIRAEYGPEPIYTIAHCMGSVAFSTGLLDGTIPADWLLGVTCSQVFMNPVWSTVNMLKIKLPPYPVDGLYRAVAGNWFSCATSAADTFVQRGINQVLRFWPEAKGERCTSATCHRISFVYGRNWSHRNLNEATHSQMDRFYGGVNMTLQSLLMKQGAAGHVMTNARQCTDLTTPENVERLRGIPFLFWVGGESDVLSAEATGKTYEILCRRFGGEGTMYRRRVVPNYGHIDGWIGRDAWRDVYPFVREEVDRVTRGPDYVFAEPEDRWKGKVGYL